MAKNILVLSCDFRETRAALIEDGIIAELHIERKGRQSSTVGNVYLGKVTRVLPGLQAAFIDIGQERAAFLHVEDLIRPDDFDEYLAGGRKLARTNDETAVGEAEVDETDEAVAVAVESSLSLDAAEAHAAATLVAEEEGSGAPGAADAPVPSSGDRETPAPAAPVEAVEAESAASEPEPSAGGPVAVRPRSENDLEATVAYPNWPHPPAGRAPARGAGRNGSTKVDRALTVEDGVPSSDPVTSPRRGRSSPPPPISAPIIAAPLSSPLIEARGDSSPGISDLVPPAEGSAEELLIRPSSAGDDSGHSLHSAPTLDELPDDEDDLDGSDDDGESGDDEGEGEDNDGESPSDPPPAAAAAGATSAEDDDDLDTGDLPGFTITEPGEPVPRAPAPPRADDR
ncbi:MAG TPA: hypothetical protein VLT33_41955, partial [Labilithrix sp.]|nr:hypothetical protein [Labilithrix sp.]